MINALFITKETNTIKKKYENFKCIIDTTLGTLIRIVLSNAIVAFKPYTVIIHFTGRGPKQRYKGSETQREWLWK